VTIVRILTVLICTGVLRAQSPQAPTTTDKDPDKRCLQCHGQAHIAEMHPVERRSMVGTRLDTGEGTPKAEPVPEAPLTGNEPTTRPGLLVHPERFADGPHAKVRCVECHTDADRLPHASKLNLATCATECHKPAWEAYESGEHRKAADAGNAKAPTCASCHGGHEILRISDRKAPQHHLNNLFLCGDCHKQHGVDGNGVESADRVSNYLASAHAKAVTGAGLMWGATCSDCHGAHAVRKASDPDSTVNRSHIPETCGKCHVGVVETYATSVHGQKHAENNTKAAVCTDCHTAHQITRANSPAFLLDVVNECGVCHDTPDGDGKRKGTYYQTYHESYHGQVTRLGATRAARCSDCHGSHDIRPLDDPTSRVSKQNLVTTCGRCHPGATTSFVKFDPHANYRDSANYPVLHGVWLYFMVMMSSVFTFFGLHTLLWFMRSMFDRIRHGRPKPHAHGTTAIRRFTGLNRVNHLLVALTFFGLTATGIPLVFSHQKWASYLAAIFGGIEAAGLWHRFFAILLIINFVLHFVGLAKAFRQRKCAWHVWIFGPNSLVPRWKDAADCFGMFRWFFGRGTKPSLDRWTYWEKFDYWAEVGGSMIIGGSGLLLWFPEIAARIVPGWSFNVAMIVHGYEALLAIGFIFTIHFFNAHIRPGTFPVDEVMFTGSMPEHELKETRPEEYKRLLESGTLEQLRVPAPPRSRRPLWVLIAIVTVGIGVTLLGLIIAGGLRLF
jgi:cytochrome b subunit of formate dehydrogenase